MNKRVPYYFSRSNIANIIRKELEEHRAKKENQTPPVSAVKKQYTYDDLIILDGEVFVVNTYLAILGREVRPDELHICLKQLWKGERTKEEIISSLIDCREAQNCDIRVPK